MDERFHSLIYSPQRDSSGKGLNAHPNPLGEEPTNGYFYWEGQEESGQVRKVISQSLTLYKCYSWLIGYVYWT
uniref:Uncharacterized protein n=1 Tax=Picea glauca TaxID=3330 RepID=A0A101M1I2_PICGL|nr:hypothetical protein ABT39_MTgene3834 [Picea glauca]